MSTAGKVLVALVTVLLVGWLIMLSMVARLNSNWGEAIANQKTQLEGLQAQIEAARGDLAEVKSDLSREQMDREHDVVVLRTQVADRERTLTETIEALERVTFQVEGQQAALRLAETGRTRRNDEGTETEKALADARQEVEDLMARNGELMARLDRLRKDFTALLLENRRLIGRAKGATRNAE